MKCSVARQHLSSFADGALQRRPLAQVSEHLQTCMECAAEYSSLQRTRSLVASLAPRETPPDLSLRLRVALSQEMASSRRSLWESLQLRWDNAYNAIMVPATAGVLTTLVVFALLIGFFYPAPVTASNDVPTTLFTPPELQSSPFELTMGNANADTLVVEAYVGSDGKVLDYRVLSAPENSEALMPALKNMLIFSSFRPATSFGQPTSGRVILSFAKVQVRG